MDKRINMKIICLRYLKLFLFIILAICLISCKKNKAKDTLRVSGIVKNKANGLPIQHARVYIISNCNKPTKTSDYTYGFKDTDDNGVYDLTVVISDNDKDCSSFMCYVTYSMNDFYLVDSMLLKRGEKATSKVTEFYLRCNLFISVQHIYPTNYQFVSMNLIPVDPSIPVHYTINGENSDNFIGICDVKNYLKYRLRDTQQNIVYEYTDSIFLDRNLNHYWTIHY